MSRATSIQAKIDNALSRLDVTDRTVLKRLTTTSGGDQLLGRGVTVQTQDTVLSPQPSVIVASKNYPLVIAGVGLSPDAEYLVTVSATAMSLDEVTSDTLSILFVDANGGIEELFIVGFQSMFLNGVDIAFDLVLASKKRPS